jgi:hypothetical protein
MRMHAVITCFFNPSKCDFRLQNYKSFYQRLKKIGMPVYAVELVFGHDESQLTKNDATVIKYVRAKDIMFQKERMLNVALELLPDKYDEIIWMDCDLFYLESDWPERVTEALETYKVVQPFSHSVAMPRCEIHFHGDYEAIYYNCFGSGRIKKSYAYHQKRKKSYPNFHSGHVGYVWAARRDFLERHKFYDQIITGAGDLFMLMAFTGNFGWLDFPDELKNYPWNASCHFFDWGLPIYKETKGEIGYTNDILFHMWHGDINNRNYLNFSRHLQLNNFDPCEDIELAKDGCWKWSSNKPKLHEAMKSALST